MQYRVADRLIVRPDGSGRTIINRTAATESNHQGRIICSAVREIAHIGRVPTCRHRGKCSSCARGASRKVGQLSAQSRNFSALFLLFSFYFLPFIWVCFVAGFAIFRFDFGRAPDTMRYGRE
jgi:hypothetical protein